MFFCLTLVLLTLPAIQQNTGWLKMRPLAGQNILIERPSLTFGNFKTGTYQDGIEKYLSENIGFREPMTRFYNQYLWDFFRKTYSEEVAIGKDDWLYFNFNVDEYYGKEMYRWIESNEKAMERFEKQIRLLKKLIGVLKTFDIDFLMYTTPDKASIYPQFLPSRNYDTTTIHAYDYYRQALVENNIPYIDMNRWFKEVQDTLDYPAIPQTSAHWVFPAVYAADSLFRFMAEMKGIKMPRIVIGERCENSELTRGTIRDMERLLNLQREIDIDESMYYERKVRIEADSDAVKPNVVFIGNSYFFAINQYIKLDEIFSDARYWFYNMTEYYGNRLQFNRPISETDRLYAIVNADYIAWFTDNAQMYKISYGFAEDALLRLCVSDSLWEAEVGKLMEAENVSKARAEYILRDDIERIEGMGGDDIPAIRNTRGITLARTAYRINHDDDWLKALKIKAFTDNEPLENIVSREAMNVMDGQPLMRDVDFNDSILKEYRVHEVVESWRNYQEIIDVIMKQIEETGHTFEEQLLIDARWFVENEKNDEE